MEITNMLGQNNLHPHRGSNLDFVTKSWRANPFTWYYPLFVRDVRVLNHDFTQLTRFWTNFVLQYLGY